jgi:NNP family nitrate/nitrite transporter-like MFS transporter
VLKAKLPIKSSRLRARRLGRQLFYFALAFSSERRREQLMRTNETTDLPASGEQRRALWMSTIAFTVCFAVWTIFSIIGIRIKDQLGLSEAEFGLLAGTPILTGSLVRMVLGIWTDRYGGRLVFTLNMLAASVATVLLAFAHTYPQMLLAALGVGLAGGSFAVGVAYVSRFYSSARQGTALGIFGAGNVGAAVTKFLAPFVLLAWGWQSVALIWAGVLAITAIVFWFSTSDDPIHIAQRASGAAPKAFAMELAPLKDARVWRYALYYFFTFGGFVALALWLPRYLIGVYGFNLETAGMLGAAYSIPASIFRAYGGVLSDRIGARAVMYWCFAVSAIATLVLSIPPTDYVMHGINGGIASHFEITPVVFVVVAFVLGFFMSLGKAAVYKHVATDYPANVGSVGGLVGMIGGLGGFVLPIAFGLLNELTGLWTSCFMLLFLIVTISAVWMHVAIRRMERRSLSPSTSVASPSYHYAAE